MNTTTARRTSTGPQVTFEATLAESETGVLEISVYRSIEAGVCGPFGTIAVPSTTGGRSVDLKTAEKALRDAGYQIDNAGWVARLSYAGIVLQAEVYPTH